MGRLLRRLGYLLRRARHEADLRDEIDAHRSLRRAQLERDGATPPDAERASRHALGNVALAREDARGVWTFAWIERAWQDLATGARILRTAPGLTLTAIALIALVIGGNATIYSMVHGILTKGAPGVDATGLFTLSWTNEDGQVWAEKTHEQYVQIAEQSSTLAPLLACNYQRVALGTEGGTYYVRAGLVSQNYFETLRIRLAKGRAPSPEESRPDAAGLVGVISHRIWQEQFGGAEDVVGRSLTINGRHVNIVGVAPPMFHGAWLGEFFDAWLPFSSYPQIGRAQDGPADGRNAPVPHAWAAQAWRDTRGGACRADDNLRALAGRIEVRALFHGAPDRTARRAGALFSHRRRQQPRLHSGRDVPRGVLCRDVPHAADRERQRRQPHARPSREPSARNRRAAVARMLTLSHRSHARGRGFGCRRSRVGRVARLRVGGRRDPRASHPAAPGRRRGIRRVVHAT